jgi:hypothetical protein
MPAPAPNWQMLPELFKRIKSDCDAVATEFGFVSPGNDNFATVKFVLELLQSTIKPVRTKKPTKKTRRKSGPHEKTTQFLHQWDEIYQREKEFQRASPQTIALWIEELKRNEITRATKSGKKLSSLEVAAVRRYRLRLEGLLAVRKGKKWKPPSRGEVKEKLARAVAKAGVYGEPPRGQDPLTWLESRLKYAHRTVRERNPK